MTPRQLQVLRLVQEFQGRTGLPPTVRELSESLGGLSTNAVFNFLQSLKRKGLLEPILPIAKAPRNLRLTDRARTLLETAYAPSAL